MELEFGTSIILLTGNCVVGKAVTDACAKGSDGLTNDDNNVIIHLNLCPTSRQNAKA